MLRIWALGCLVWFSMFRTHSPLLSPLILRMLSLHANALFLVSKELSNTNQAILLRICCTHSFGRRQERFIPSSLVFSILLTFIVVILALVLTDTKLGELVVYWVDDLAIHIDLHH